MSHKKVILKKGREKALLQRHHWLFSGAVASLPSTFEDGEILPIFSHEGEQLASAYFNRKSSIIGRVIAFGQKEPLDALKENIEKAFAWRNRFFNLSQTNTFRLINGEGDGLPGLIVDRYNDVLVIQISTLGMEYLKEKMVELLLEAFPECKMIYEKSTLATRKEEGLPKREGKLWGEECESVVIKENGILFSVTFPKSQKTGFFLDQREMRRAIEKLARGKKVLNTFCYTGGFSLFAARGGAKEVTSVDISEEAVATAKANFALNSFDEVKQEFVCDNVFDFLRKDPLAFDLIILDPPAFAKKKGEVKQACRGYKDINRVAMQKMPPKSLLLTCSCSYHVEEKLFRTLLFQAAVEAKREVQIIDRHHQAFDHPINIFHPEGDYLKSFLLAVE